LNSAEAQLRAESELQASESLVWSGVPNARRAAIAAIPETITPGIALVGFALLWTIQVYSAAGSAPTASSQTLSPVLGTLMLALALLIAGLLHFARPLWVYRRALSTVYAVTSHRVMIIRGNGSSSVNSLDPAEIVDVQCRERQGGSGDVMIGTNFSVRTKNVFARRSWWFYGVPSVKEVVHLVSELKQGRTKVLSRAGRFVPLDFNSPA
jgi:hypothetical protein